MNILIGKMNGSILAANDSILIQQVDLCNYHLNIIILIVLNMPIHLDFLRINGCINQGTALCLFKNVDEAHEALSYGGGYSSSKYWITWNGTCICYLLCTTLLKYGLNEWLI